MTTLAELSALSADWYDCSDVEQLTHSEPVDAIEFHVQGWLTPNGDTEAQIRAIGSVEVKAYRRRSVSESEMAFWAEDALVAIAERFDEEYSDPESAPTGVVAALQPAALELVKAFVAQSKIWACEEFARLTIDEDELVEICRKEWPEWFAEKAVVN